MKDEAWTISTSELLRIIRLFNQAVNDSRATWEPALPLEVALIEACRLSTRPGDEPQDENPGNSSKLTRDNPIPKTGQKPRHEQPSNAGVHSAAGVQLTDLLDEQWPQVLSMVREKRPNLSGLLNSCQSRHLDGSVLILGFASDLVKNMMDTRDNIAIVQEVISQLLGVEIIVRCGITSARSTDIPTEVDGDGMVASALRDLGGEIVDIQ